MNLRIRSRSIALDAARIGMSATGLTSRLRAVPGDYVLLLHNTIGTAGDALISYVDDHRQYFESFPPDQENRKYHGHRRISLSFDDGFISNLNVGRSLAERGLSAVFYVPTDVVGMAKDESDRFFGRPQPEGVMTWANLEELGKLGHQVGSHCKRHVPLATMSLAEAEDQVRGSLQTLRERLGTADHFAWPFGSPVHAQVDHVTRWCSDEDVTAASGVRGSNSPERFATDRYLRRDAVDLANLSRDIDVFLGFDSLTRSLPRPGGTSSK